MQTWRYLVVVQRGMHVRTGEGENGQEYKVQDFLDVCGTDGWELVTTEALNDPDKTFLLYLKRPAVADATASSVQAPPATD